MKFLIDMNLSPRWGSVLRAEGWDSVHWSQTGHASASDQEVMQRALGEHRIVLTHDLDYGAMLAATQAVGPSVVQVRTQDLPDPGDSGGSDGAKETRHSEVSIHRARPERWRVRPS